MPNGCARKCCGRSPFYFRGSTAVCFLGQICIFGVLDCTDTIFGTHICIVWCIKVPCFGGGFVHTYVDLSRKTIQICTSSSYMAYK